MSFSELTFKSWKDNSEDNLTYFKLYAISLLSSVFVIGFQFVIIAYYTYYQALNLHDEMVVSLVKAPINTFHNDTTKGRILNRLQKDLEIVDLFSLALYGDLLTYLIGCVGTTFLCGILMPLSLVTVPIIVILSLSILVYFLPTNRDINRLSGSTRSPLLSTIDELLSGASNVRAFKLGMFFKDKFLRQLNDFYIVKLFLYGTQCWFYILLDIASWIFIAFILIFFPFFKDNFTPVEFGLLVNNSDKLEHWFFKIVTTYAIFEYSMISTERCLDYSKIKSERQEAALKTPEVWPVNGQIELKNYSAKYKPDNEVVLKDLSFKINPGEKVGVVGRTGSGKSTLCLCLFRILEAHEGQILIDGLDVSLIKLEDLRQRLSIIPQDPVLMKDTLRYNLDPLNQYSDEEILEVLKIVHLMDLVNSKSQGIYFEVTA